MMIQEKLSDKTKALAMFYYHDICKKKLSDVDDNDFAVTANTIDYLFDCELNYYSIFKELRKHKSEQITYNNLSAYLWKDSLIKKDAFYLHKELRLVSPAPQYDFKTEEEISYPYYCEMKIIYTEKDVLNYFRSKLSQIGKTLQDDKSDLPVLRNAMKKFSMIDYVEPLDVIMHLIDSYDYDTYDCSKLIDVMYKNHSYIQILVSQMQELEAQDLRKMVRRSKCAT